MKKILTLVSFLTMTQVYAGIEHAPANFTYKDSKAVYVDFKTAKYDIVFNHETKKTTVESTIVFYSPTLGRPLFDLIPTPLEAFIDGTSVAVPEIRDPDSASTVRMVDKILRPGRHTLKIRHELTTNVVYGEDAVAAGFWMSDLNDRRYLEQYLPSNLEFDQFKMDLKVKVIGARSEQVLKANGKVTSLGDNTFSVSYPEFYSTSSIYFHLFRQNSFVNNVQFYLRSMDGRLIPVDIYTSYDVQPFVDGATAVFNELEADYGAWPHEQLIIYGNAPSGGMEHSGATITSLSALGHEMMHSYHARSLMPANGNAGWMDEAMARWRDNKYPLRDSLNFNSTRLAGRSQYTRMTDRMAYAEGSAFLSWIGYRMDEKGLSMKGFLRDYYAKFKYTTVTTELFRDELSKAAGMDLTAEFNQYIYGRGVQKKSFDSHSHEEDPMHPRYTEEQLKELTWL